MEELDNLIEALDVVVKAFRNNGPSITHVKDELTHHNNIEKDFLHKLELEDHSYHAYGKMMKTLKESRIERRVYKDKLYTYQAIEDTFNKPGVSNTVNVLGQLVGNLRKIKSSSENRQYTERSAVFQGEE